MVRFGSYLKAQRQEEWSKYYLDYEGLDEMIMALAEVENASMNVDVGRSGYGERVTSLSMEPNPSTQAKFRGKDITEADFFTQLESEMEKIDNFTHETLSQNRQKIEALVERATDAGSGVIDMPDAERRAAISEAKRLGDEFLRIEKFANLNYMGFHKILKKHDKKLPATPCRRFYLTRLHQQRWIRHDYSRVFVNLGKVHALLRGDPASEPLERNLLKSGDKRSTQMFWVRVEDISKVKHVILQHLPVWEHDLDASPGDSQLCNSVYLDNTQLELYHGRLDKSPDAIELRLRWYTTEEPRLVYVERKRFFDSWNTDVSAKERFSLRPDQVLPFLKGELKAEDKVHEMREAGLPAEEIEQTATLFRDMQGQIDAKQLEPTMRTIYNRVTYQVPFDERIRISFDTGCVMHLEDPPEGPDCFAENRWFRNPKHPLTPPEVTNFPHAVLEVKLALKANEDPPQWVSDLVNSGLVTLVHKFSKYIHACAALLADDVQVMPFWIDDESIQGSLARADQPKKRIFGNDDEGELKPLANGAGAAAGKAVQPEHGLNLMKPRPSLIDAQAAPRHSGYGTISSAGPKAPSGLMREAGGGDGSFFDWLCGGWFRTTDAFSSIPLKVEPKQFLANERTYLNWLHMAVVLATGATGLLGFTTPAQTSRGERAAHLIGMIMLPVAMLFCVYALGTFYWRGKRIRHRDAVVHDEFGPMLLGLVNIVALSTILMLNLTVGDAP